MAWVVNQTLTPLDVRDPVLVARRSHEAVHLQELSARATRTVFEPWRADVAAGVPTSV
jgi:arsenite-transporting ATPase